jgi:hypothetical protein
MTVLTFPEIVPDAFTWAWEDNVQSFESDLTRAIQHARMAGGRWRGALSYTNRDEMQDNIYAFKAFLMRLGGPSGRFSIAPPDLKQRGSRAGTGVVATAAKGATTITTTGWVASQGALFKAGDYIQIGDELKMIVQDAASNGSGAATLVIAPAMRKAYATGTQIITNKPKAVCYLESPDQVSWQISTGPMIHAISLSIVEDVT